MNSCEKSYLWVQVARDPTWRKSRSVCTYSICPAKSVTTSPSSPWISREYYYVSKSNMNKVQRTYRLWSRNKDECCRDLYEVITNGQVGNWHISVVTTKIKCPQLSHLMTLHSVSPIKCTCNFGGGNNWLRLISPHLLEWRCKRELTVYL